MNRTHLSITDTDKTPLVEIFVWIPLALSVLAVCARLGTKLAILKKLQAPDHIISLSLVFSIGQSVAVSIQCANGFGQYVTTLTAGQEEAMLKAEYAADLLFIASLSLVKMSIIAFINDLTPIIRERYAAKVLGVIITLWTISSLFSSAFQCSLPRPWDSINGSCFNQTAFWNHYAAMNIITDLSLIIVITAIAIHIHTSYLRRFTVIAVFGTRILVIAAVALQIYYFNKPMKDPAFDPWPVSINTQCVLCLSIVTACIPYLKPFLSSLESGMMRADDLRRRGETTTGSYNVNMSDHSGSKRFKLGKMLASISFPSGSGTGHHELSSIAPASLRLQPIRGTAVAGVEARQWDDRSQRSQTSQSRIIRETRSWNVEVESIRNGT